MKQPSWNGLIPGVSTIHDAVKLLGQPSSTGDFVNGKSYDFVEGYVRITILRSQEVISKIRLSRPSGNQPTIVPSDLLELTSVYGEINVIGVKPGEGLQLEAPGIRALADPSSQPEKVIWLEIFQCQEYGSDV